eukprot:TRINITY_DN10923_c0_g2_i2.p1 TRINITY_DN10923_c0_g2~~TRINITY_DN10923_c0_g2_i2.p1  ORF type:complete len:102 (+),score=16.18 TRINITY_DN10923_c0_g2_i2:503-808(+)
MGDSQVPPATGKSWASAKTAATAVSAASRGSNRSRLSAAVGSRASSTGRPRTGLSSLLSEELEFERKQRLAAESEVAALRAQLQRRGELSTPRPAINPHIA